MDEVLNYPKKDFTNYAQSYKVKACDQSNTKVSTLYTS